MTLNYVEAEVQFSMDKIKEKKTVIGTWKKDGEDTRRIIARRYEAIRRIEEARKKAELEEEQRRVEDQEAMERLQENAQWVMEQIQGDRRQQVNGGT